jgi:hypothetical protein
MVGAKYTVVKNLPGEPVRIRKEIPFADAIVTKS